MDAGAMDSARSCSAVGGNGGAVAATGVLSAANCSFYDASTSMNGGGLWGAGKVTLENCALVGCSATGKGNGGGVFATGALTVAEGSFDECEANGQGGGVYAGNTLTMTGSKLTDCRATGNGGTVYLANDNNRLENVTINGHKNLGSQESNAASGGAIYLANGKKLTIAGGSISGCSASGANGGAINCSGNTAKLYFEGDAKVHGNPAGGKDQRNVVLDQNTNAIINVTENGLSEEAMIGIYVVESQWNAHGDKYKDFGTKPEALEDNLDGFVNDKSEMVGGTGTQHTMMA